MICKRKCVSEIIMTFLGMAAGLLIQFTCDKVCVLSWIFFPFCLLIYADLWFFILWIELGTLMPLLIQVFSTGTNPIFQKQYIRKLAHQQEYFLEVDAKRNSSIIFGILSKIQYIDNGNNCMPPSHKNFKYRANQVQLNKEYRCKGKRLTLSKQNYLQHTVAQWIHCIPQVLHVDKIHCPGAADTGKLSSNLIQATNISSGNLA